MHYVPQIQTSSHVTVRFIYKLIQALIQVQYLFPFSNILPNFFRKGSTAHHTLAILFVISYQVTVGHTIFVIGWGFDAGSHSTSTLVFVNKGEIKLMKWASIFLLLFYITTDVDLTFQPPKAFHKKEHVCTRVTQYYFADLHYLCQ